MTEWAPATLSGWHPWGFLCLTPGFPVPASGSCTNSWLNYRANNQSALIPGTTNLYPSIRYRVRFYVPSFPTDDDGNAIGASMLVKMKVDNWGTVWINGEAIPEIIWGSATINGSAEFARSVKPGLNTVELVIGDGGGLAGFTYLIELAMQADEPLTTVPAENPSVSYQWIEGGFGECSQSCGGGTKTQSVQCQGSNGFTDATGVSCNLDLKPQTTLTGNTQSCDSDGDGVGNDLDICSATPAGELVDATGCSYEQRVANYMEARCQAGGSWKNHGAYVSCVAKAVSAGVREGVIMSQDASRIVSSAAQSSIGKK